MEPSRHKTKMHDLFHMRWLVTRLSIVLLCGSLCFQAGSANAVVTLSGDTSRPEMSTYAVGESIGLDFSVTGMTAGQQDVLNLNFVDELGQAIGSQQVNVTADGSGNWSTTIARPSDVLGFYRVQADLNSSGATLPALGSRSAGYLTYAVVPDPAERTLYGEKDTFFGMQGAWNSQVNVLPYLGVRWGLDGSDYKWGNAEPNYPGQFADKRDAAAAAGQVFPVSWWTSAGVWPSYAQRRWKVYSLPYIYYQPPAWAIEPGSDAGVSGILKPEAEGDWQSYLTDLAGVYTDNYPNREENIYQITWEPVSPCCFSGTDEQLIRIHELAYEALHAADPKAVVIGPTGFEINERGRQWLEGLLQKGLGNYIDGISIHPYITPNFTPEEPEQFGLVEDIRAFKATIFQYTGEDLPIYGTEQGFPTQGDPDNEIIQARGLIRSNLIFMGEGFQFNFAFYNSDFFNAGNTGFGLYYNLDSSTPFGTAKIGPKSVVPAYAAMTFLLEGHKSTGPIDGLSGTTLGYAYEDSANTENTVLALWDYSGSLANVVIDVGVAEVELFDWMGNSQMVLAPGGMLSLTLGLEPLYVKYVAGLAGDFDYNGIVNGSDFLLWQRDTSIGNLADWEANFGASSGLMAASAVAVPEPTTAVLLGFAVAMAAMLRRRRSFEFSPA